MALERTTTSCSKKPGRGCWMDELWHALEGDVPEILSRLDALGSGFEGIRLREAEQGVWDDDVYMSYRATL
jgi:hypothetical protein